MTAVHHISAKFLNMLSLFLFLSLLSLLWFTGSLQARLRVLKAQDDHLQAIFQKTRDALKTVTADTGKYNTLLYGVLLQSCLSLLEKDVNVRARACDASAIEGQFAKVAAEYLKLTGQYSTILPAAVHRTGIHSLN